MAPNDSLLDEPPVVQTTYSDKRRGFRFDRRKRSTASNSSNPPQAPWSDQSQGSVWSEAAMSDGFRNGCCGRDGDLVPPWMDWVESGIEFFGCDESVPGKSVFGRTLMIRHAGHADEKKRDYAKLHDDFLEALLHEHVEREAKQQQQKQHQQVGDSSLSSSGGGSGPVTPQRGYSTTAASSFDGSNSGISSSARRRPSGDSSFSDISGDSSSRGGFGPPSFNSTKTQKRRRPFRLHSHRQSPARPRHARVAPIEAYTKMHQAHQPSISSSAPKARRENLSIADLASEKHPKPETMMHPECRIQKDKGKGEPIGSIISAKGREACLEKLRQKMELLMQVALGEERKGPTGMKRRSAKIASERNGYTETRSIIELRMGFLSMQYGLLLRWDTQRTGKIVFIVLRKMCHDSFYTKCAAVSPGEKPAITTSITKRQLEAPPLVIRNLIGNHAIYQRPNGTEVVFVDPPYRIPQPEVFTPSVLSVEINNAAGLSRRSRWTLSLTFDNQAELMQLHWNAQTNSFVPKQGNVMQWEMADITSFDLAALEIRLFEQRKRPNAHNRLAATMTMPLGGLVAQPSTSQATSWQVTIPCSHDQKASVTFSFSHQSDYAHWLYKELDARRREEVSGFVWRAPFRRVIKHMSHDDHDDDDDVGALWDWLCSLCFPENSTY